MRNSFFSRFFHGTSGWNAVVLLVLLLCYVALAYWLRVAHIGSTANSLLLGGFVLLLLIGGCSIMARAKRMSLIYWKRYATAICGHIDPGTLEVTYATAGHPPAILVDKSGKAQLLQYDGLPLGVEPGSVYPTFKLGANHDSLLILYTDGLLEYDHDLIEGERRMLEAARNVALQRLSDPAGAIEDAIFKNRKPLDDVAILTVAFHDTSVEAKSNPSERWSIAVRGVRAPFGAPETAG